MTRLKRHRAHHDAADLDVTPFMNLMIVLVPVLLMSMVFTHTTVIDLNFPSGDGSAGEVDPDAVHLEVIVSDAAVVVADGRGGIIKRLPKKGSTHDYHQLSLVMRELKKRLPEKDDVTILLDEQIDYQTLVHVMDRVRSFKVEHEGELVNAELFPTISLGDSPVAKKSVAQNNGARTSSSS